MFDFQRELNGWLPFAAPNRRLPLGLVPWSFGLFLSQSLALGELIVSRPRLTLC